MIIINQYLNIDNTFHNIKIYKILLTKFNLSYYLNPEKHFMRFFKVLK